MLCQTMKKMLDLISHGDGTPKKDVNISKQRDYLKSNKFSQMSEKHLQE